MADVAGSVWIVGCYGSLPAEGQRDYRAGLLAKALAARGCRVTWWTSSFNHTTKRQRSAADARSDVAGLDIRLVPASAYHDNISVGRVLSEWRFGRAFQRMARCELRPDIVVLLEPARFYGHRVAQTARAAEASLVIDVIDLWPEAFEMLAPRAVRRLARLALAPLFWHRNRLVRQAQALVGVTQDYVDEVALLGGFHGPRHVAYWGSQPRTDESDDIPAAVRAAAARPDHHLRIVIYAGALGSNYDIATLVAAAQRVNERADLRWLVLGAGPQAQLVEQAARAAPGRLIFLGLQDPRTVAWLLRHSDVGLCCYREGSTVSMPIKAFDYFAAGLPIVNSLGRELGRLVLEQGVGLQYDPGNAGSLGDAVVRLCSDEELRRDCAQRARALARQYDADAQHAAYAEFLLAYGLAQGA